MPLPGWRIYYGDGSTYSDLDGPPELSPGEGVQVIVQRPEAGGRALCHGGSANPFKDHYIFDGGTWYIVDAFGLSYYLRQPGWKLVRLGTIVSDKRFHEIVNAAVRDPDFQPEW